MKKLLRYFLYFVGILLALLLALLYTFTSAPLPEPKALLESLPIALPPPEMAIFQLPTGLTHRTAAFGYRGGSFFDNRDFSMTAILIKHPKGDILIDTGFGSEIDAHFAKMPFFFRLGTNYEKKTPAAVQLAQAGYDLKKLHAILLTHAHWDHVSGITDFPKTPVLITADERGFIESDNPWSAVARSLRNVVYQEYDFEDKPYLGFSKSHDFYGDGSIVIVSAAGHTPGSIIVFVTLPNNRRYAFVGDLVWQREGITEREEKPWLMRRSADSDSEKVRENILRMSAIATRFPEMIIVPAHDSRAFAEIPQL